MSGYIPFEIQIEIIKRLPVKSLMQSRSLSKPFKSLVDSSQFIADYNACESRPPHLFLRYDDPLANKNFYYHYQFLSIAEDDNFPQHNFTTPALWHFAYYEYVIFVGDSNGLLCFYAYDLAFPRHHSNNILVIWNPSLKKQILISIHRLEDLDSNILGFGVHPNTNDPMIVRINHYDFEYPRYIEVITSSSRSRRCPGRSPRGNEPRKSVRFKWSQVDIDGFIYWHAFDTINRGNPADPCYNLVMSFDMRSEEFIEINLPECLVPCQSDESLSLSKLRESLVVLQYYKEVEKPVCDVWKMTNGVTKSFTKQFTVDLPLYPLKKILGFRKTGEPIVGKSMDGHRESNKLELHQTTVEDIKEFVINGQLGSFFVTSYKETLLLHDK